MIPFRKLLPFPGHKHMKTKMCFRTYCECGWSSCAHWERREAYGEWREHVLSHGGEYEPWERARLREERENARLLKKYEERRA